MRNHLARITGRKPVTMGVRCAGKVVTARLELGIADTQGARPRRGVIMNWQAVVRRQAVGAWRDEQIVQAYSLFNATVRDALATFEQTLVEHARLYDTIWDPIGYAEPRIDVLLRKALPHALAGFLDRAATQLGAISPEFEELAEALRQSYILTLPQATRTELPPAPTTAVSDIILPQTSPHARQTNPSDDRWAITKGVEKIAGSAGHVVKRGAEIVQKQADMIADTLQDKAGLRDRVRNAAQRRIASHWMGEVGDPLPVLAQLVRIIDTTTVTARMTTL